MEDNPYQAPLYDEACRSEAKSSACYLSTPQHVLSFVGRFIYIYTDKGELTLNANSITFVGKQGVPLVIPLDLIVDIRGGHYSRWAKPLRLDYIAVRRRQGGAEETFLLTPTMSWATPVWQTNRIVADWKRALEAARLTHA
ncbi:MAG TPA: hypothetical protein VG125_10195 [Pirellulales bacterium]|jgi:hypothetical protein|nr:hypothetical protein [Pirellulales bacterium]